MTPISLGNSDPRVSSICLGAMTFGEQVNESDAHAMLDHAFERGVDFLDTAEMYAVPARGNFWRHRNHSRQLVRGASG
ncbi:MAG: aldo/keto reductase [Zoogloeaceae bacterium]|jgi:aryl-alcohol dehydrogenase-like predicted oxidoreductase|nr:aldo/keto reductase [Zoogloeaceae bacterium]